MADMLASALNLHQYLLARHWTGQALVGPDPGIRLNARVGRFVKSYLDALPWSDDLVYMQAQGYWIMNQWLLADLVGDTGHSERAIATANYILSRQQPDGYWQYPNPEWKGRVATVEGCFAALGLLECYARTGDERCLTGAKQWHEYLTTCIGFRTQADERMLAVNYFVHEAGGVGGGVPNNSTLVLWNLARLAEVTQDDRFLAYSAPLLAWLAHVQCQSGELPYELGSQGSRDRVHFLCYQYNAFECMDLIHYYKVTQDQKVWPILERLGGYLANGLTAEGAGRYECAKATPEVTYYTSAIAQALSQLTALGIGDFHTLATAGFQRVLSQQRSDGGFAFHSSANYGILSDRRSYPRYLSMILHHMLREQGSAA